MSRIIRSQLLYNGCYAHIISRSIRKERILKDQEDFSQFLGLLKEAKRVFQFKLFHYCLMQTHFHLVVQIKSTDDFARALNYIKSRYACAFHTKYKLSGPIWRERYRSLLIEDLVYLLACGRYVEYNPVKANIVKTQEEWEFSLSQYYLLGKQNDLIDQYDLPEMKAAIDYKRTENFERGNSIGSEVFKFKQRRGLE